MSFINNFQPGFAALPEQLTETVIASLTAWDQRVAELNLTLNSTPEFNAAIAKVWCSSVYVADSCIRKPELLVELLNSGDLSAIYSGKTYAEKLAHGSIDTQAELMTKLREFRRREMVRIAWRDLAGWAELAETLTDLSHLADACIQYALDFLYQEASELRGTP
jgi:glutamate-ammonia-ligase adenylyltransferase